MNNNGTFQHEKLSLAVFVKWSYLWDCDWSYLKNVKAAVFRVTMPWTIEAQGISEHSQGQKAFAISLVPIWVCTSPEFQKLL